LRRIQCEKDADFTIGEIEPDSLYNIKRGLLEGKSTPLPTRFCLIDKPWQIYDSVAGIFKEVPFNLIAE
jgi:hypothetical protein